MVAAGAAAAGVGAQQLEKAAINVTATAETADEVRNGKE